MEMAAAFPRCWQYSSQMPTVQFLLDKEREDLQFLVSQGAFQAYSPKLPGSCRQLHSTHTGVMAREEGKRRNDPTTDVSDICWKVRSDWWGDSETVRRDYRSCWFRVCFRPTCITWVPLSFKPLCQAQSQVSNEGYFNAFREKGSEHFYCVKNNVFLTNLLLGNQWIILAEFFHKQSSLKQTLDMENFVQMKHSETLYATENRTCKWEMMGKWWGNLSSNWFCSAVLE